MAAARVLVVDDEELILNLATRALSAAGYDVVQASTPHRALELVNQWGGLI
jgi:CheY-like chemotaxis protein